MKNNKKHKKFPKSTNDKQCLGPCYKPGTSYIHPVLLTKIKNKHFPQNKATCPTNFFEHINQFTGKKEGLIYDECDNPTNDEDIASSESLLLFESGFTKNIFLNFYYNINSFGEALEWINENSFAPLETRVRVLNSALNYYGDKIDYLDEIFIDFYILYIKEKHIKSLFKEIHENIGKQNNEIMIIDSSKNNLKFNDNYIERINYISEKFLDRIETKKFLTKYIKSKNISFENYNDVLYLIFKEHITYIKNIINNILHK